MYFSKTTLVLGLPVALAAAAGSRFPNCDAAVGPLVSACVLGPIASAFCSDILHLGSPAQTVTVPSTTVTIVTTSKVLQTSLATATSTNTVVEEQTIPVSTSQTTTTAQQSSVTVTSVATSVTTTTSTVLESLLATSTSDIVDLFTVTDITTATTDLPETTTVPGPARRRDVTTLYDVKGQAITTGSGISRRAGTPFGLLGWVAADINYACSCLLGPAKTITITKGSAVATSSVFATSIVTVTQTNEQSTTKTNTKVLSTQTLVNTINPVPTTFTTLITVVSTASAFSTIDLTSTIEEIDTVSSTATATSTVTSTTIDIVATATASSPCSPSFANTYPMDGNAPAPGPFTFYTNSMTTVDCCNICWNTPGCVSYSWPHPDAAVSFTCGIITGASGTAPDTAQCPTGKFSVQTTTTPASQFDVSFGPCGTYAGA